MLLQNSNNLENCIVAVLNASKSGLSALEIRKQVQLAWKSYSMRGIYKELERLEREGVVTRSKGIYSIRLAWIVSLHEHVDTLLKAASDPDRLKSLLPDKQTELRIHCSDLVRWDLIWTQLMLTMHIVLPKLPMFIWAPRHWFNLTHPEIELKFMTANAKAKNLRYCIIGGRGYLDKQDAKHIARKTTGYTFKMSPFEYDRNHYYWIIGDYVGVSSLDLRTARKIDQIYEETKKQSDFPLGILQSLRTQKCKAKIQCTLNPRKAAMLRAKFLKMFGLNLSENGELTRILSGEL